MGTACTLGESSRVESTWEFCWGHRSAEVPPQFYSACFRPVQGPRHLKVAADLHRPEGLWPDEGQQQWSELWLLPVRITCFHQLNLILNQKMCHFWPLVLDGFCCLYVSVRQADILADDWWTTANNNNNDKNNNYTTGHFLQVNAKPWYIPTAPFFWMRFFVFLITLNNFSSRLPCGNGNVICAKVTTTGTVLQRSRSAGQSCRKTE